MDLLMIAIIIVLLLIGAAGARADAPAWVTVPSIAIIGVLMYYQVITLTWAGLGSALIVLAVFLLIGCAYAWGWWEFAKLRTARRDADARKKEIVSDYDKSSTKTLGGSIQDYMVERSIIPLASRHKAEITGRVVVWPMHLLGDALVWPGRWLMMVIRGLRGLLDRRARAKFADFGR